MLSIDSLTPGKEHAFLLDGHIGQIEVILTLPKLIITNYIAILGHPHPLQAGTMNNKVVTTMARALQAVNIPSLRFNFRGVGQSVGSFDQGVGESQDMLLLFKCWHDTYPNSQCIWAGFSFGSYVAYRAWCLSKQGILLTIAPPVHRYDYLSLSRPNHHWIIFQGDKDELIPIDVVINFVNTSANLPTLIRFDQACHFFHGQLAALKLVLIQAIKTQCLLS